MSKDTADAADTTQDMAQAADEQNAAPLEEGANQEGGSGSSASTADVKDRPSTSGAQNIVALVVLVALMGGAIYLIFGGSDKKKPKSTDNQIPIQNNRPQTSSDIPVPTLYSSGPPSGAIVLKPTKKKHQEEVEHKNDVPPPPPEVHKVHTEPAPPTQRELDAARRQVAQQQQQRMNSNIMVKSGGGVQSAHPHEQHKDLSSTFKPIKTSASSANVTKVGNLTYLITQGKIMEGVLETPINTNYPGPVRAVLSRDVYSEKGENVLIPKGSRLIGSFAQGVQGGHARVAIQWKRIIMPNGYDINVTNAPGVDSLGQVGTEGDIHREFFSIIGNAVMLSLMNIVMAQEVQKRYNVQSSQSSTTTNASTGVSSSTTTSNPTQQAAQQQVQHLGNVTEQWFKENFQAKPFVTISQGTVVKIFVNQDIRFPSNLFSGINNLG